MSFRPAALPPNVLSRRRREIQWEYAERRLERPQGANALRRRVRAIAADQFPYRLDALPRRTWRSSSHCAGDRPGKVNPAHEGPGGYALPYNTRLAPAISLPSGGSPDPADRVGQLVTSEISCAQGTPPARSCRRNGK
jgi:hypothetical protein